MAKFFLLFFLFIAASHAQQKITLEDIYTNNTFATDDLPTFHFMHNSDSIISILIDQNGASIQKYSFENSDRIETILDSRNFGEIKSFDSYQFSSDETKIIVGTNSEKIFRRSSRSDFFVYDRLKNKLSKIAEYKIQEPLFSPDGLKVAYAFENNLYVKDLLSGKTTQITSDGEINKIINGITDWVYEEEFYFVRAFEWNAGSDKIAFIRFDESEVPEFAMDMYGNELYPGQMVFKYPKAGEKNSEVSLHLYDLKTAKSSKLDLGNNLQHYIPGIQWTNDPNTLAVTTLNRYQNNMNLLFVDSKTLKARLVLNEKDAAYIKLADDLTFLHDNSFIWSSERDGFNHLYHYDKTGKLINQITKGNWEVTDFYGYNGQTQTVLYQSTEEGSTNRSIYSIGIAGNNKKKLSKNKGTNSAVFSSSFQYYINTFSSTDRPFVYTLNDSSTGEVIKEIKNNDALKAKTGLYRVPKKEISVLQTKNGDFNMLMMKPNDFDPSKEYPLLMYQYSGPGSQSVSNSWYNHRDFFHATLVQEGFIVAIVDGRGTGFKGRDFKKMTYKQLGRYEVEDQIEAALVLGKEPFIDEDRIGIWGGSYGGYMSCLAITKGADVFKMAIALAPVTSWRYYDSVYTERYMQTPQENPLGYDENSPLNFAHLLKGDLLIVHGTGDDNVHVQNSMQLANALIKANKDFDFFVYPDRSHGISEGKNTRVHLYRKMSKFIHESIGKSMDPMKN